ncbi:MAG: DUF3696 domain-containing protein [Microbacterium sp.]
MSKNEDGEYSRLYRTVATSYSSRLLTQLRVRNVKSLAGEHSIPLAPLTLVYGPNAAGKSSIIQSLLLAAQSINADGFTPRGPLVDVRDFGHVVNGHDTSKELTIGVRFTIEQEDSDALMTATFADEDVEEVPSLRVEGGATLTFYLPDGKQTPELRAAFEVGSVALLEPSPVPVAEGEDPDGRPYGPYFLRWTMDLSDASSVATLTSAIEGLAGNIADVRGSVALLQFASDLVSAGDAESAALECWVDPMEWVRGFHAPTTLRLSLERANSPRLDRPPIMAEGRGLLPEDEAYARMMLEQWAANTPAAGFFDLRKPVIGVFTRVEQEARGLFQSASLPEDASPAANSYRERSAWDHRSEAGLVSLGPMRPTPKRVHLEDGDSKEAELALIRRLYRNDKLLAQVNEWLERLDVPYSVAVDRLVSQNSGVERGYSFELTDTRSGVEVSLADVGYGVSQVLPIITECVGSTRDVICIEQPELHLHPRLAGQLAELLVETVARGSQVIAETHSESILLRVRRLVRGRALQPEDVAVLYVENAGAGGAKVSRLRLGEQGQLLDPWPTGFFDDGLADILGTAS